MGKLDSGVRPIHRMLKHPLSPPTLTSLMALLDRKGSLLPFSQHRIESPITFELTVYLPAPLNPETGLEEVADQQS